MINRCNACVYNTSVMPRKIYCTYSTFFNTLHIQSARTCPVPLARKFQGGKRKIAASNPRLSASQIVIYRNGRSESGLIHHDDFPSRRRKSSVTSTAVLFCSRHTSRLSTLFRDKCTRHIYKILRVLDWRDKQYGNFTRKLAQNKKKRKEN